MVHVPQSRILDYDTDGLLDLLVCNVGKYTSDRQWPDGVDIGLPDAFRGHLHPERFEYPVFYKNLGHNRFKEVTAEVGLGPEVGAKTQPSSI